MKLSHSALGLVAIVSAGSSFAMPAQWDPFLECSKSFVPVSRPAGHMETVVAERVVTTCVRVSQPSLPSITDSIEGIRPGAGNVSTILDTPCPKIPAVVDGLKSKIAEYTAAISQIDSTIASGNEAQKIIGDTISALSAENATQDRVCAAATGRYNVVHNKKMGELRATCRHVSIANRPDCIDGIDAEANISPSVWPAFENMNDKCKIANDTYSKWQDAKTQSEKYKSDLIKLQSERQSLNISKIKAQRLFKALNQELANCRNP